MGESKGEDFAQGSVVLQQGGGGDQILNRDSQASSLTEEGITDSPGGGFEEGNKLEDSGVAFPFLGQSSQEDNKQEFEGENKDGNLNEEGGNFLGGKKEEWEEGGGILGAGSLGEDMVTGWKLRSEEETKYQTDIFS